MVLIVSAKKAISPLIAVVIMIVVVVGLGAVATGVIKTLVNEQKTKMGQQADFASCSRDVVVDVITVDKEPQICMEEGFVDVVLENKGGIDVDDFQLMVFGTTGIYRNDSWGSTLAIGQTDELNMTFSDVARSDVEQVKIVPKLKKTGESGYFYCTEAAIVYEWLDTCD